MERTIARGDCWPVAARNICCNTTTPPKYKDQSFTVSISALTTAGKAGTVQSLQDSPNAVTIRAASESGGFLVLADTFYPDWQATLDGKPVEILRANYAFRAVALPPGEHTVVFRYLPRSFLVGSAISLLTLLVTVGALVVLLSRRR